MRPGLPLWSIDCVDARQRTQQQVNSQRHGSRGDDQADRSFFPAAQREAQAQADHEATRSGESELTLPPRTMTSRSA